MIRLDDRLQGHPASLREDRDGRSLFVWGDLGQWLVVDAEAALLIQHFGERRTVHEVLRALSNKTGKPLDHCAREALPLIDALVHRGLLGSPPPAPSPPQDPVLVSNLTYNITNRCNLRCPWCYNGRVAGGEAPISDVIEWIKAASPLLDPNASFIILGGEPFFDQPRLVECTSRARELFGAEILVSTNGTLLTDDTARSLARANVTIQVSIDSATADKHNAMRGRGVFAQAIANASRLIDAGVHTILSMVLMRSNEEEMEAYFDLAMRIGAQEVRFIPLRRIGQGASHGENAPDLAACFQRLLAVLRRRGGRSQLLHRDFFSILMTACRFSRLRGNCGIGRRCLFIDADGTLFPCPNHREEGYRCGHVRTDPLSALLDGAAVLRSLRTTYRLEAMTRCRECPFRYWCAGDCRAEALAVTGDPGAPSPYCLALQRIMTDMFWLIADGWLEMGDHRQQTQPWS